MSRNYSNNYNAAFAQYLQSMVKLEELQKMTEDLDKELEDSQKVMSEIKTIFNSIPNVQNNRPQQQNNEMRHEDLSQFIVASVPKLTMPDMPDSTVELDVEDAIANMKRYVEDFRKNFVLPNQQNDQPNREYKELDLKSYASSLDQLSKLLVNIKVNKSNGVIKNKELETKLAQLCEDVKMFTQMVQAKTRLSESNMNWTPTQQNNMALQYDNLINKLLLGINEVTYLLKNKN